MLFTEFGSFRTLFLFLQLDGNAPEELLPWISFLVSRVFIIRELSSFTTYELDRLTIPILGKVKRDSSWNPER